MTIFLKSVKIAEWTRLLFSFGLNFILAFRFLSFDKYRINQNQNQNLVIAVELHFFTLFFQEQREDKFACCRLRADLVETDVNLNLETSHPIKEHFHVQSNALPVSYIPYIKAANDLLIDTDNLHNKCDPLYIERSGNYYMKNMTKRKCE